MFAYLLLLSNYYIIETYIFLLALLVKMIEELRTSTISSKGQIAIPKELRKKKGFREGQKVVIIAFEDRLEIRKFDDVAAFLTAKGKVAPLVSESSLAKLWNTPEEDKAWKHLQKER